MLSTVSDILHQHSTSEYLCPKLQYNTKMFEKVALVFSIGITLLGAFSRLTHGQYTPAFHRYQVERAPNDASTRYIPILDLVTATLLIIPTTRTVTALLAATLQGLGIAVRVKQQKPIGTDVALAGTVAYVAWSQSTGRL
jgi:hypothetical protein